MGFPRQEYWSVLPFPPPGDLPDPGIEPESLGPLCLLPWQADCLPTEPLGKPPVYSQNAACSRFEVPAVTVQTEIPHSAPAVKPSSLFSFVTLLALRIPPAWALQGASKEKN